MSAFALERKTASCASKAGVTASSTRAKVCTVSPPISTRVYSTPGNVPKRASRTSVDGQKVCALIALGYCAADYVSRRLLCMTAVARRVCTDHVVAEANICSMHDTRPTDIYLIQNRLDGKQYIGQVVQNSLNGKARGWQKRWTEHKRTSSNPESPAHAILHRAIAKHGVRHFSIQRLLREISSSSSVRYRHVSPS